MVPALSRPGLEDLETMATVSSGQSKQLSENLVRFALALKRRGDMYEPEAGVRVERSSRPVWAISNSKIQGPVRRLIR